MKINGLNVDTRKIAEGLYDIIEEKGGMLSAKKCEVGRRGG
jgi:hypothetical protein